MKNDLYLGIDVGTSGLKALLVDAAGRIVDEETVAYPLAAPRPLWAEQDPEDWWQAAVAALRAISGRTPCAGRLAALGLTGQMHGSVFLDRHGAVIRPAILWCDQRTGREAAEIETRLGRQQLVALTGNPAFTGFTAPKVLWLRRHEPDHYRRVRRLLLPKDYLRLRLTGDCASEVTDNSGTSLFDIHRRRWSPDILAALEIDPAWLAPVHESPAPAGRLSREAAALTGLPAGLPLAAGAGDQAASAVGCGIVGAGDVSATIGTSGVVFAFSDQPRTDAEGRLHTMCHAVPGAWHLMGCTLSAGAALRWFRDEFCAEERKAAAAGGADPYALMAAAAEAVPAGSDGLLFLPYLAGERTPHADPNARGVFFGLTAAHTRAHLIRAVMEGVVFALRDTLELMKSLAVPVNSILAAGGGARSATWCRIQADIFQAPLTRTGHPDTTALGAAILGACAAGRFVDVPAACAAMAGGRGESFTPDPENARRYAAGHALFRRLYPALKPCFDAAVAGKV